jgi:hypothetical protein
LSCAALALAAGLRAAACFLGHDLLLQALLQACEQFGVAVDAIVLAQVQPGHGLGHVLQAQHPLALLGVEVDFRVLVEQRPDLLVLAAAGQQFARGLAQHFAQRRALGLGPVLLLQHGVQRQHPLPVPGQQIGLQRSQQLAMRLAVCRDVVLPRRQRLSCLLDLADQRVEPLLRRAQRGAGSGGCDLQGISARHGASSGLDRWARLSSIALIPCFAQRVKPPHRRQIRAVLCRRQQERSESASVGHTISSD